MLQIFHAFSFIFFVFMFWGLFVLRVPYVYFTNISCLLYDLEGFHVAVGGLEAGDGGLRGVEEALTEGTDGFLGGYELYVLLHLVVGEGDGAAEVVDVGDVRRIDDVASAETLEMEVAEGFCYLYEVLEACQQRECATVVIL